MRHTATTATVVDPDAHGRGIGAPLALSIGGAVVAALAAVVFGLAVLKRRGGESSAAYFVPSTDQGPGRSPSPSEIQTGGRVSAEVPLQSEWDGLAVGPAVGLGGSGSTRVSPNAQLSAARRIT